MKKSISFTLSLLILFSIFGGMIIMLNSCSIKGATYYISSSSGSDENSGKSSSKPWKTFKNVNNLILSEGDKVLLKRGDTWNERLTVTGTGSETNSVTISSYGNKKDPLPRITLNNLRDDICMVITDVFFEDDKPKFNKLINIVVENLAFTNANVGLYVRPLIISENDGLIIRDCEFTDIWCDSMLTMMGHGFTIDEYIALNKEPQGDLPKTSGTKINKTGGGGGEWTFSTGLLLSGRTFKNVNIYNLVMENCITGVEGRYLTNGSLHDIVNTGSYAGVFRLIGCRNFDVYRNRILGGSEKYTFFGGTCGGFVGNCTDVTVRNNEFAYEYSHGENDGCGFDFEAHCTNTTFKDNVLHHNESGGILIMQLLSNYHVNVKLENNLFYSNILNPKNYGYCYDILYYNRGTDNLYFTDNYFYTQSKVKGMKTYFYGNASNSELNVVDTNNSKNNITDYRNRFSFNKDGNTEGFTAHEGSLTNSKGNAVLTAANGRGAMLLSTPINGFCYNTVLLNVVNSDGGTVYCQYETYSGIKTTKEIKINNPGLYKIPLSDEMIDSFYKNFMIIYKSKTPDGKLELDTVEFLTDINVSAEKTDTNKITLTFSGNSFPVLALEVLKENLSIKGYTITEVQKKNYNKIEVTVTEKIGSLKNLEVTVKGDLFIQYFKDLINGIDNERTAEQDALLIGAEKQDFYYNGSVTLIAK